MIHRFEQQDPAATFIIPRSCATPQHGKKPDSAQEAVKRKLTEQRSFEPRPGH